MPWPPRKKHANACADGAAARAILAAAAQAGMEQVLALTDPDNIPSRAVAIRLGMCDEDITQRWFGLTSRQYRKDMTRSADGPMPQMTSRP